MQISTNRFFDSSATRFATLQSTIDRLQTEISSGRKLIAPSDDPVGYQRLQGLDRGSADNQAWKSNIVLAQTLLQQSDTALGGVADRLQRVQELTVQASNGPLAAGDRQIISTEIRAVLDDLVGLANTRDVRGQPLFGAATGDSAVTRDATGAVAFAGTGEAAEIPIGEGIGIQPTLSAERVFGGIPTGAGSTDIFALIGDLAAALESGAAVPTGALDNLNEAVKQIANARGIVGARSARLELETARIEDAEVARATERSAIADTDVNAAIVSLQKAMTVLQATQASFGKLSQLSLFDYLR